MDDNNIGAINVVGDIPWKHSEEPEELVKGKGFRLFESVYNAKVNEAGQLNLSRLNVRDAALQMMRLWWNFSDRNMTMIMPRTM